MNDLLWNPSTERIENANITAFTAWLNKREQQHFADYAALYQWSCDHKEKFWQAVWEFSELNYHKKWDAIYNPEKEFFTGEWFPGMQFNFAENLLRHATKESNSQHIALIFCSEDQRYREMTYSELYQRVAEVAAGLRSRGVIKGDRIAGILPNIPETIIAMLATTSLGAVWASCSPDFGAEALADRLTQLQPTFIFTTDGYIFKGKSFSLADKILALQDKMPKTQWVVIPYLSTQPEIKNTMLWHAFILPEKEIHFVAVPFNHPVYILFSSGTTGKPKCIVHTGGGTLIQHVKELLLHTDVKPSDRFCFYTTCGWMMWNWMVSGLALGTTLVLYEGSPMFPHMDSLLQWMDQLEVSIFGTSAAYFAGLAKAEFSAKNKFALTKLKTLLSTGSPLLPEQFDYIYQQIKTDVCLSSISGGTDIISCFVLGNPTLPVYRGECQCRGLGMAVEVVDQQGAAVIDKPGELVCTKPFPSMPLGFWQDEQNEKYRAAYFAHFPGVWWHGDYAQLTEQGGVIMMGRADSILNPGGVRIGSAEIYRPLVLIPEIEESIVVGQEWEKSERIVLFVKLREGSVLDEALQVKIKETLRTQASPRHVPAKIVQVPDIPKTLNGKLAETAVKNVVNHQVVNNKEALANPEVLRYFEVF